MIVWKKTKYANTLIGLIAGKLLKIAKQPVKVFSNVESFAEFDAKRFVSSCDGFEADELRRHPK